MRIIDAYNRPVGRQRLRRHWRLAAAKSRRVADEGRILEAPNRTSGRKKLVLLYHRLAPMVAGDNDSTPKKPVPSPCAALPERSGGVVNTPLNSRKDVRP
jgi:hypothetical protein